MRDDRKPKELASIDRVAESERRQRWSRPQGVNGERFIRIEESVAGIPNS